MRKETKNPSASQKNREVKKEVAIEVNQKLVSIRKEKKKNKATVTTSKPKPAVDLKVGDKVRIVDGKSVGSIDAIEKQKPLSTMAYLPLR